MPRNIFKERLSRPSRSKHTEDQFNRRVMAGAVYETADSLEEHEKAIFTEADTAKLSNLLNTGGSIEMGRILDALQTQAGRNELKAHLDKLPPVVDSTVTITPPMHGHADAQSGQQTETHQTENQQTAQQSIPNAPPQPPVVVTQTGSAPVDLTTGIQRRKSLRVTKQPDRLPPTETVVTDDHDMPDNILTDNEEEEEQEQRQIDYEEEEEQEQKQIDYEAKRKSLSPAQQKKLAQFIATRCVECCARKKMEKIKTDLCNVCHRLQKKRRENELAKQNLSIKRKVEEDDDAELLEIASAVLMKKVKTD